MNSHDPLASPAWTAPRAVRWMKNAFSCVLVAIGALMFSGTAEAATQKAFQTIEDIPFAFSRANFPILDDGAMVFRKTDQSERITGQFQGFDPGLGTLQKVDINIDIDGRIELVIRSSAIDTFFGGGGTRVVDTGLEFISENRFNGAARSELFRRFTTSYTVESSEDGGQGTVTDGDSALILNFLNGASVAQSFDAGSADLSLFESAGSLPFELWSGIFFHVGADCTPAVPVNPVVDCDANARFRLEGNYDVHLTYTYDDLQDPSVVPLPAGLPLLGAALMGLAGLRRLRKQR